MTTYYVSPDGSDANNGLGPDASHATNKPKLTLKHLMTTSSLVAPGDIIYVAPGYYKGEGCTPISAIGSAGNPTQIIGDPLNQQGFKTTGGVRRDPGICWISTRGSGEAFSDPTGATGDLYTLTTNSVKGLAFRYLVLETDTLNGTLFVVSQSCAEIYQYDCRLIGFQVFQGTTGTPVANRNWWTNRCELLAAVWYAATIGTAPATADVDLNIGLQDSILYGARMGTLALSPSGGNLAGGVYFKRNLVFSSGAQNLATTALRVSTVKPIVVEANVFIGSGSFVNAGTAGQVSDGGYNIEMAAVANTNYTRAGTSIRMPAALLHTPIMKKWGVESVLDELFSWHKDMDDVIRQSGYSNTTADFRNLTVRPWGTGPSIGPLESFKGGQDATSQITSGSLNSLKVNGAGVWGPFYARVNPQSSVLSIKTKSSSYGGTNYPRLIIDPNPSIGYAGETIAATDATEQTISSASFTPTAKGVVRFWLESRSSSGASSTYFDLPTVA